MEVLSRCAGHDDYKIMPSLTICLKRKRVRERVCERVCAGVCVCERERDRESLRQGACA